MRVVVLILMPIGLVVAVLLVMTLQSFNESDDRLELDPAIPPSIRDKYKSILDAQNWENPYLVVHSDSIELISKTMAPTRQRLRLSELRSNLVKLPKTDWPYGRVIAVQNASIASDDDAQLLEVTRTKANSILTSLSIQVEPWPG